MKRTLAMILALLLLFACGTALADTYYWDGYATQWGAYYNRPLLPLSDFVALRQSLREAGRFAVAQEAYVLDHTGNRVLSIVARDDSSQLTILQKAEDGQWIEEARNDTIPFQQFNQNSAGWTLHEPEDGPLPRDERYALYCLDSDQVYEGHYSVELDFITWPDDDSPGNSLRFDLYSDEGGWFIQDLHLIHNRQEEADDCILSYYSLRQRDGGDWKYDYFEIVDYGQGLERTRDPLYTAVLDGEETMARMRLDAFDYPALLSYLNALLPDDLPDAHSVPGAVSGSRKADGERPVAVVQQTSGMLVYYNAAGGKYYHAKAICDAVAQKYWPLTSVPYDLLNDPSYRLLLPCPHCNPPERPVAQEPVELPEFVYYNSNGGRYYHAVEDCPSVSPQYQPLSPIPFAQISDPEYARLVPCPRCNPVDRPVAP